LCLTCMKASREMPSRPLWLFDSPLLRQALAQVGYCLWREGARLVVCDGGGPGMPRLVQGGELAEGGRGLRVVEALAARWGSFRLAGALAVWCDFGQPLRAAANDAWAWLPPVLSVCDLSPAGRPVATMPGTLAGVGTMSLRLGRAGAGLRPGQAIR
jgi:hypothetical protein